MTIPFPLRLVLVANALLFCIIPLLSRPGIFFATTVPESFRHGPIARTTLLRYRAMVMAGSAGALAMMQAASSADPRLVMLPFFIQSIVATAAWIWAHRETQPHAVEPSSVRTASLEPRDMSFPGGAIGLIGPFLILGATALFLHANWELIPDRFPTRWRGGTPSRWATKSLGSVYGILALGATLVTAMQVQAWLVLHRTKQIAATGASAVAEWQFKQRTAAYAVLSTYMLVLMVSYFATRKVATASDAPGVGIWLIMGGLMALSIGFTGWMVFVGQGGQRRVPHVEGDRVLGDASPDSAWKAGLFYFNPADPAVFVERRRGLGWTPNFGNKWAWLFMIAAMGVPFLALLLSR